MTKEQIDYLITGMFMRACDLYLYRSTLVEAARPVAYRHMRQLESAGVIGSWAYPSAREPHRSFSTADLADLLSRFRNIPAFQDVVYRGPTLQEMLNRIPPLTSETL